MPPTDKFQASPLVAIWEVTRACDLACVHCRASANPFADPRELSPPEALRAIDQLVALRPAVLVLTGGDPLKRRDLLTLIERAVGGGLAVAITPSVTPLLTAEAIRNLAKAGVSRIALSLDGPTPEVHDTFRGMPGAFAATMRAIQDVRGAGLALQINTSLSASTFPYLSTIGKRVAMIAPSLWSLFFVVPVGRAKASPPLTPEQCEDAFQYLHAWSRTHRLPAKTTAAQAYRRVVLQNETKRKADEVGHGSHLPAVNDGKGFLFVSHTGEVYPSGFLPISVGNLRESSLTSIYREHPFLLALRDSDRLEGKCGRCAFRGICGGSRARAYAVSGNPLGEDPSCVYQPPRRTEAMATAA